MESFAAYAQERKIAILAVHRASLVTKRVLASSHGLGEQSKSDASPVTIADFAAQALLISAIHTTWPEDRFIGEESADALRNDPILAEQVWSFVKDAKLQTEQDNEILGKVESLEHMLDLIDLGVNGLIETSNSSGGRLWIMDPVDGTQAYIKQEQYAVCLALLEDGVQKVGVLGCPNLSLERGIVREDVVDSDGLGWLIYAVQGQGAFRAKMDWTSLGQPVRMTNGETWRDRSIRWIESETKNRLIEQQKAVASAMNAEWPGVVIWSMQMKYMALACGGADVLVRLSPPTYKSCVWDHAGGQLIYTESGGKITDAHGKDFDFTLGRQLDGNYGIVAAHPSLHARALELVRQSISTSNSNNKESR